MPSERPGIRPVDEPAASSYLDREVRSAAPRVISFVLAVSALAAVSSASGAASAANLGVNVVVGTTHGARPDVVLNGASVTVNRLDFIAGMAVEDVGPEPADVHVRLELPAGLRWGADVPDPSESCTSTPTTGDCTPATLDPDNNNRSTGWVWDVIADAPGTYVLKTSVVSSSKADPDLSDNVATATVVVQPASTAAVAATAARVLPARPRAGSVVVARVGVTAGGNPV